MKRNFLGAILALTIFASCSKDDELLTEENEIIIPENYTFENNNNSSVDFSGQTTRLQMAAELIGSFNDFDNETTESLSNKFSNSNNPFSSAALNESDKSIKSKVAASKLYFSTNTVESTEIKNDFEAFITEQMEVVKANREELAQQGVAGQISDGSGVRYVNAQGLEMNQAFAKSLIGGLVLDQILNNYLSQPVLDEGDNRTNNTQGILEEGKNYTTMAHKWDEGYGYLYGDPSIPAANPNSVLNESQDRLLFNYLGRLENDPDFAGIAASTFEAFKKGRAAIAAGEYEVRDEQVMIIRENLSKVIAVRAIYYLQGGKEALAEENYGSAFHDLSEGYGFIYSLRFTNNPETGMPYLSKANIDEYKEQLLSDNGFWDVTPAILDRISEDIASAFGITVAQAAE